MSTSLRALQRFLFPAAFQLLRVAAQARLNPRVTSTRRSYRAQAFLYRRFLAGQSQFPAAPPGSSTHELGLAFDLWINDVTYYEDLGKIWESWGGTWGGRFRDPIHFEAGGAHTRVRGYEGLPKKALDALSGVLGGPASIFLPTALATASTEQVEALRNLPHSLSEWWRKPWIW